MDAATETIIWVIGYWESTTADMPYSCKQVLKTAEKIFNDPEHILNLCYKRGKQSFVSAKSKTTRFCDIFIPTSIRFLNLSVK